MCNQYSFFEHSNWDWDDIHPDLTIKLFYDLSFTIECSICTEVLCKPVTIRCGHSFCYNCISKWFRTELICPYCRTIVTNAPILNYTLNEIVDNFFEFLSDHTVDDEERRRLILSRRERFIAFDNALELNGLFGNLFIHLKD
ncbi:PSH1 [[Candida] subhashii]|uniref:PSH1 n=1 Tax=[Candida] subhashii TaxID=561895 RepID=A0A8J5UUU2_9ASCO|nr:PSH1 [[Candida] subhashii]KAG7661880.1 PSH1 [[Candida] subhashii]